MGTVLAARSDSSGMSETNLKAFEFVLCGREENKAKEADLGLEWVRGAEGDFKGRGIDAFLLRVPGCASLRTVRKLQFGAVLQYIFCLRSSEDKVASYLPCLTFDWTWKAEKAPSRLLILILPVRPSARHTPSFPFSLFGSLGESARIRHILEPLIILDVEDDCRLL